jgi:hypothetical protein
MKSECCGRVLWKREAEPNGGVVKEGAWGSAVVAESPYFLSTLDEGATSVGAGSAIRTTLAGRPRTGRLGFDAIRSRPR